jgi:nucleoside-diphosphate-sugar epimerase
MKILITGSNGLLGRNLLLRLAKDNEVHALVREQPSEPVSGVYYHVVDLSVDWPINALPNYVDSIIHLAQSRRFREFPEEALDVFKVNIESTARLLDYANKVGAKQFFHASSGGVYDNGSDAFSESSPIIPPNQIDYYVGSKLIGEIMANSYSALMQVVVMRFFFIYGYGQNRSMLIPRLVDNVRNGRAIALQGKEGIRINPIHVTDAAAAVIAALGTSKSATYNIAGPDVLSLKNIGETIGELLGVQPHFEYVAGQPDDLIGDAASMRMTLHVPEVRVENGIKDLL